MHSFEKWRNMLLKFCGVNTTRFLKYVWPFFILCINCSQIFTKYWVLWILLSFKFYIFFTDLGSHSIYSKIAWLIYKQHIRCNKAFLFIRDLVFFTAWCATQLLVDKLFKNGLSEIYGRQLLNNFTLLIFEQIPQHLYSFL